MNCSYVACNSFIKANVPHYITSEPRVTAEHLGTSDQNLHHFWRPASLALPVCAFLLIFLWISPFILYATLDPALRTGSVNKDVNHTDDSFFRYYGSEERPWACTRSEWSPDRRWHDVTSPGRPGFPSHVSNIKAEGASVNCAHNSRSIIREVSRYTALLFSSRTQLTSDFQVFLSIQVEEMNSALLSVFHSSFRM